MDAVKKRQITIMLKNDDPNIRCAAALYLGMEKTEGVMGPMSKLLRDKVWQVRQAAAKAIGAIGQEAASEALLARLGANEANARTIVMTALSQPRSVPASNGDKGKNGEAKDLEDQWQVRQALALATAKIRPDLFRDPFLGALEMEKPEVKIAAISGLANVQDQDSVELIIPLCEHPDVKVQRAAVIALGKLASPKATETLVGMLKSNHGTIRSEAVIALNHIKDDSAFEALAGRLKDPDSKVRMAAVLAVGNTKRDEALEMLQPFLEDTAAEVRGAACKAMVTIKAEEMSTRIADLMLDTNADTRSAAAMSFVRLANGML